MFLNYINKYFYYFPLNTVNFPLNTVNTYNCVEKIRTQIGSWVRIQIGKNFRIQLQCIWIHNAGYYLES